MLDTCLSPVARVFLPPRCRNDAPRHFSDSLALSFSLSLSPAAARIFPPACLLTSPRFSLSSPSYTLTVVDPSVSHRRDALPSVHPPSRPPSLDSLAKIPISVGIYSSSRQDERPLSGGPTAQRNTFLESPRIETPGLVNQRGHELRTFILSSCY